MAHTASLALDEYGVGVNDTVVYLDEIEVEELLPEIKKAPSNDPFKKAVDSTEIKKRALKQKNNRLQKKLEGQGGAKTKYIDPEEVIGYSLFNVVVPPYDLLALAELYDESYILRSIVDARTQNTVALGIEWKPTTKAKTQLEKTSDDEDKGKRVRAAHRKETDKLTDLFANFNQEETVVESLVKVWTDVLTLGNGYLEIGRKLNGEVGYIGHVPAALVRVRRPRDGFVQQANQKFVFFRNFGDKETVDFINGDPNPNELVHFKLYTPTNNWYGVPPSVSALSAIVGDKFAKEFNIDYFENKAIPRYAIILKGVKLSNKSKQELMNYIRNEVKGKNHGTLVIPLPSTIGNQSEADVKFEKLEADIQDASFDKYRKSNRDEVIVAYRTPPTKVGVFENANLAVSRDADKTFKYQVIGPDQNTIENKLNRVVKEFSDLFTLEFVKFDILDDDTRSKIWDRLARIQAMLPNEIRSELSQQPITGGDYPLPFADPNLKYTMAMTKEEAELYSKKTGDPAAMAGTKVGQAQVTKDEGGGQFGNANAQAASPKKSGEDNGTASSNKDTTGTAAEKGQRQDEGKTRDRTGGK